MTDEPVGIPQPTPFEDASEPEVPEAMRPPPRSTVRLLQTAVTGHPELAVLFRRTYAFAHERPCRLSDEQVPLAEEHSDYDEWGVDGEEEGKEEAEEEREGESSDDGPVSYRKLSDLVGYKPGTDVVVHGSARSPRPVSRMTVRVEVGDHRPHEANVIGKRRCEHHAGRVTFSDPEPFDKMPLRYENAYGGRDPHFEEKVVRRVQEETDPEVLRRARSAAERFVQSGHPLMYPRNRFGKGYVIEADPAAIRGKELPNVERPSDPVTPERLVVGNPLDWNRQPLPVGFGYLDASSFPRCSMFGLPPATIEDPGTFVEVERGFIPPDFCRGNIFSTSPDEMGELIHPWAGRCASPDLMLPFLQGNEPIRLNGFDPVRSPLRLRLPGERPRFRVSPTRSTTWEPAAELYLVDIDVPARTLSLVWAGRVRLDAPVTPERLRELESSVHIEMMGV